jgi:tetratricopeptide (TPR) repeat protein
MKRILLTFLFAGSFAFGLMAENTLDSYNMRRAIDAARSNDDETAIQFLAKELEYNPNNAYAHIIVAEICFRMKSYGAALEYTQNALKYLPKTEHSERCDMYGNLYELYLMAKDTTRAMEYLELARKENPKNGSIYNAFVSLHEELNNPAEVLRYAQLYLKFLPDNPRAYVAMATAMKMEERYDEAIRFCDRALLKAEPESKERCIALLSRAQLLHLAKRPSESLADLMQSFRIGGWGESEKLLDKLNDTIPNEVLDSLLAIRQSDPDNIDWLYYLYNTYIDRNEYANAVQTGFEILPGHSNGYMVNAIASVLQHNIGDAELAERMLLKQLSVDSTNASQYILLEDLYSQQGRYAEAMEMADKALLFDPEDKQKYSIYIMRGRMYEYKHEYQAAVEDFQTCLIVEPDEDGLWFRIAKMYGLMNDSVKRAEALEQGRQAFARKGKNLSAAAYVVLGDTAAAYEAAQGMVKNEKSDTQHYNKACVLAQIGYSKEAIEELRLALENGFCNFYHIAWDADLNNLRDMPEFVELVNTYKQRSEQQKADLRSKIDTELNY